MDRGGGKGGGGRREGGMERLGGGGRRRLGVFEPHCFPLANNPFFAAPGTATQSQKLTQSQTIKTIKHFQKKQTQKF